MLCPEVWNFPPPKVFTLHKMYETPESLNNTIRMNNFYKSLVITFPDEIQRPSFIEHLLDDTDYYKIEGCSLVEFINDTFIENFVKSGNIYCYSYNKNCIVENCVAITPDGILTLHILDFIYQTLGFEGTKTPHNYYEIRIDLKNIKQQDKVKHCLSKLECFDLYITWEPDREDICPSSIAKYFHDRNINVTLCSLDKVNLTPMVNEIPSVKDVDIEEMVEWIGMLAHNADLTPNESYISSYSQPESKFALKSTRIYLLIVKGFVSPTTVLNICEKMSEYTKSRELDNYWTCLSVQSEEESLWQWSQSAPRMFQSHDSSCNIFFTQENVILFSVGQLKYS